MYLPEVGTQVAKTSEVAMEGYEFMYIRTYHNDPARGS